MVRRAEGPDAAADTVSTAGTSSAEDPFAEGPGAPTTALSDVTSAGSRTTVASSNATSVPDERAVWVSQRLRIRSTQNLVDIDLEADATPRVLEEGGDCRAAAGPDAGFARPLRPPESEENEAAARQRRGTRSVRGTSPSATTAVARHGRRMRRDYHTPSTRTGTKAAPGPTRTRGKVRVKAFDIRVEEYKEERRHVSGGGFSWISQSSPARAISSY